MKKLYLFIVVFAVTCMSMNAQVVKYQGDVLIGIGGTYRSNLGLIRYTALKTTHGINIDYYNFFGVGISLESYSTQRDFGYGHEINELINETDFNQNVLGLYLNYRRDFEISHNLRLFLTADVGYGLDIITGIEINRLKDVAEITDEMLDDFGDHGKIYGMNGLKYSPSIGIEYIGLIFSLNYNHQTLTKKSATIKYNSFMIGVGYRF